MFKGQTKEGVAATTTIQADERDLKKAQSEFNQNRIREIQESWITGSELLVREKRLYIREGVLRKMCRKGLKPRYFFMFNDILVYGTQVNKNLYNKQHILALKDVSITDIGDDVEPYGIQINHKSKSFHVFASSKADKDMWMKVLQEYIEKQSGRKADEEVAARAVWVPDSQVKKCMVCQEKEFSVINRRHHCRSCGRVVCGGCSQNRTTLFRDKQERVCDPCYAEIQLSGSLPKRNNSVGIGGLGLAAAPAVNRMEDSSSGSDSDDDDEQPRASAQQRLPSVSRKPEQKPLNEFERKMHEMSNEERLKILLLVKDGKCSQEEALDMVWKEKKEAEAEAALDQSQNTAGKKDKPPRPAEPEKPPVAPRPYAAHVNDAEHKHEGDQGPAASPASQTEASEEMTRPSMDGPKPRRRRKFKATDNQSGDSDQQESAEDASKEPEPEPEPNTDDDPQAAESAASDGGDKPTAAPRRPSRPRRRFSRNSSAASDTSAGEPTQEEAIAEEKPSSAGEDNPSADDDETDHPTPTRTSDGQPEPTSRQDAVESAEDTPTQDDNADADADADAGQFQVQAQASSRRARKRKQFKPKAEPAAEEQ